MGVESIHYSSQVPELETLLGSINRPGDYCVHGRLVGAMPRLNVDSVGTVAFPIQLAQIQSLIQAAERAPYGRGPDTVLDTSVRDCWQIDAGKFRLDGLGWDNTFKSIMTCIAEGIGRPAEQLVARPYKVLVYEPGGFFTPHRDTEKESGMVATLVVSLPTDGSGGELVVRHKDREMVIDMCVADPSELAFAAFFADCTHETRPVKEGHRVALVFNLILNGDTSAALLQAPDFAKQTDRMAELLSEWRRNADRAAKIVWLLEHDYSEAGISFATLKGIDAAVGQALAEATARAKCAMHAAIVEITEFGSPDYTDYYDDQDDFDMGEVDETNCELTGWVDQDDNRLGIGSIPLLDDELLPVGALDDAEPDDRQVEEASGNAGVSVEYAYRRAALVVWPQSNSVSIMAQGGISGAIEYVASKCARIRDESGSKADTDTLVAHLVDAWIEDRRWFPSQKHPALQDMLELLYETANPALTTRFLESVVVRVYAGSENDALIEAAAHVGPDGMRRFLPVFARENLRKHPAGVVDVIWRLTERHWACGDGGWTGALQDAASAVFGALAGALEPVVEGSATSWNRPEPRNLDAEAVCDLFSVGWTIGLEPQALEACRLISEHPQQVTPDRVLPKALGALKERSREFRNDATYGALWLRASEALLARSSSHPEKPRDWHIDARFQCDCKGCRQLQAFCDDPTDTIVWIAVAQSVRQHLREVIKRQNLDISYQTERRGRPYSLICTKNRVSFNRRLAEYEEDLVQIKLLVNSAPDPESSGAVSEDLAKLRKTIGLPALPTNRISRPSVPD